jgi:hypothetical protein
VCVCVCVCVCVRERVYVCPDTQIDNKKQRFEWIGHVARIDLGRTVKKIFES